MTAFDEAIDDLGARAFAGAAGVDRLAPLLRRYDAEIGVLHPDDPHYELLHALRTDWALCDAEVDGPGDTWAWRIARSGVVEVPSRPSDGAIARSIVGVFEVWRARTPWLREPTKGICVPLADRVHLEPPPDDGPAALWELRICIVAGRGHLCRPPLAYPLEALAAIRDGARLRLLGRADDVMPKLRRAWLAVARAPRADPHAVFTATLRA